MRLVYAIASSILIIASPVVAGNPQNVAYDKLAKKPHGTPEMELNVAARGFSLKSPDNSNLLLMKLRGREAHEPGELAPHAVLTQLLKAQKEDTFEWILDHHSELGVSGLASLSAALDEFDFREAYVMVGLLLNNKNVVVYKHTGEPPPPPYWELRICDGAYNSLSSMLNKHKDFPPDFVQRIYPNTPIQERDAAVKRLNEWWSQESNTLLLQRKTLTETRPSIMGKMQFLQDSLVRSEVK